MPLIKSASKEAVGKNISTEVAHGRPRKQAIAIALETQRRAGGSRSRRVDRPRKKTPKVERQRR